MARRLTLKEAPLVTMDERIGDFERADILVDGDRIAAVGPALEAADADEVDMSGVGRSRRERHIRIGSGGGSTRSVSAP